MEIILFLLVAFSFQIECQQLDFSMRNGKDCEYEQLRISALKQIQKISALQKVCRNTIGPSEKQRAAQISFENKTCQSEDYFEGKI